MKNFENTVTVALSDILTTEERAALALRLLYAKQGYVHYKMSKFEEYELYVRNKDFLVSDSVLTFTDTDGRLRALKPDVTLSIVKNGRDTDGKMKVYYDEQVYRAAGGADGFREITQVGLECIGKIDESDISEVLSLASESLAALSDSFVLDVSSLDFISALITHFGLAEVKGELISLLGSKNSEEIYELCLKTGAAEAGAEALSSLANISGGAASVIPFLEKYRLSPALSESIDALLRISAALPSARIDFSVVSDVSYYNGFTFRGFIEGVPTAILSGGQYDGLMKKMGRRDGAVGFAVYLDELEKLASQSGGAR